MILSPTLALTGLEIMYLTGKTLRLLAAEHDCFLLFDTTGTPVLDEEFYEISKSGIKMVE